MDSDELYLRYQELQRYVGWTDDDARQVRSVAARLELSLGSLIDDFYAEIERHSEARKVITGGPEQIERLKGTLRAWLRELLFGPYDRDYVARRWRVGWRHVEIGLDQVFTNVALSRLRQGLLRDLAMAVQEQGAGAAPTSSDGDSLTPDTATAVAKSLNMLLDLDLAIIEDAYQTEYLARQQRSERLAAIGQVAGGIAHELRNPLNVVKTSIYFLLNARNPSAVKTAEHLQRIERQVVVADSVITALSNFAKMPLPNLRPIPLATLLSEVLEVNFLPETIVATIDCPESLPAVLGDKDQMSIVFGNLVRNGREAMPQGGRLTMTARRDGDAVEVEVKDNGAGIPPDNLGRIMEPLYSTKARGLGLGLAIARAILDKNKGSLRVTSVVGQGTTFTVRLLAALEEEASTTRN